LEGGLAVHQPDRPARELWPDLSPDVVIVIAYGHILRTDLLQWPQRGCVNLHASLLPRHRGASPVNFALMEGDAKTGVTSMYMVERLDAGDILLQRPCSITEEDTAETLAEKLSHIAAEVCLDTLGALETETVMPVPQDESKATYAPKLKKEDAPLDWGKGAKVLCRRIRGLRPWPVARTRWVPADGGAGGEGGWIRVWMAVPDAEAGPPGVPAGTVGGPAEGVSGRKGVRVAAADGWVLLTEVQPEGGRRMDAEAFWRGHRLPAGAVLG
jgi:methionyl-tRNA formyltransferase